jgi:hypothetical protein
MLDNSPRFQRWIGFWMLLIAIGAVMLADVFSGIGSALLAAVATYMGVWLFQHADNHPARVKARNAEVARIERELDD